MYRKALRLAWAQNHNPDKRGVLQTSSDNPTSDNPTSDKDYNVDKFLSDVIRPIIYHGTVIDSKNPLYFSNGGVGRLGSALNLLNNSGSLLVNNKNFLNIEAIRLIKLIRDDPPSPPSPTTLDKLLEHIYGFIGDSTTMIGVLDIQASIRTYLPDDIIPEKWATTLGGSGRNYDGGSSSSILDLYRSPL